MSKKGQILNVDLEEARRQANEKISEASKNLREKAASVSESASKTARKKLREGSDYTLNTLVNVGLKVTEQQKKLLEAAKKKVQS